MLVGYRPTEISGEGRICRISQFQKGSHGGGFAALPDGGKQIFLQHRLVGEKEDAVSILQTRTAFQQGFPTHRADRNSQHTESRNGQPPLVNLAMLVETRVIAIEGGVPVTNALEYIKQYCSRTKQTNRRHLRG